MTIVHEVRLVQVNPGENKNRFYVLSLDTSGTLTKRWGRVGTTGQTKIERNVTLYDVGAFAQSKERRGYQRVDAIDTPITGASTAQTNAAALAAAAKASLVTKSNKTLDALIERIATANKHAITLASGGQITFNATGQATTALGVISASSVSRARTILDDIVAGGPANPARPGLVAEYLTLVPQKVGSRRGWDADFAADAKAQAKQYELLDALVTVVPAAPAQGDTAPQVAFRYKVDVADAATTKRIAEMFEAGKSPNHPSARLKVKRVYVLTDDAEHTAAFEKRASEIRNVQQMWHGSRAWNILNILRTGLHVPTAARTNGMDFHGALFGPGAYFAPAASSSGKPVPSGATKAANYAYGGVWSGSRDTGSVFVFLADVAAGSEFRSTDPLWAKHGWRGSRTTTNKFGKPWNSISVKGGTAGVINDERIVWDGDQVSLRFLVELG